MRWEADAMAQNFVVMVLVAGCFVYALWTLAPKAPRSRFANALLKMPLPRLLQRPLTAAARQQGGCACDGCDRSVTSKAKAGQTTASAQAHASGSQLLPAGFQPVTFVRGNCSKKATH
jgi:hypothetical protein